MCAVILRERQERAALVHGTARLAGALFNLNPAVVVRCFDEYLGLLSRRDLDVEALREHVDELRRAHERVVRREHDDRRLLRRLEAMGEHADRTWAEPTPRAPTSAATSRAELPRATPHGARPPSRR